MVTKLTKLVTNWKKVFNGIFAAAVGILLFLCVTTHNQNKKLSESLKMANCNIEAYQGILNDSQQANNVLQLNIKELSEQNDKLLHEVDSVRKKLNIKAKQVTTAATQTQKINVTQSKGVQGDLIQLIRDTVYTDSMKYNDLTTVYYSIGTDSVDICIDMKNTQYLYIYTKKQYKNKKSFIKRLLTFDFKKVKIHKYEIVNTNDLLKNEKVRIIEQK